MNGDMRVHSGKITQYDRGAFWMAGVQLCTTKRQ